MTRNLDRTNLQAFGIRKKDESLRYLLSHLMVLRAGSYDLFPEDNRHYYSYGDMLSSLLISFLLSTKYFIITSPQSSFDRNYRFHYHKYWKMCSFGFAFICVDNLDFVKRVVHHP